MILIKYIGCYVTKTGDITILGNIIYHRLSRNIRDHFESLSFIHSHTSSVNF